MSCNSSFPHSSSGGSDLISCVYHDCKEEGRDKTRSQCCRSQLLQGHSAAPSHIESQQFTAPPPGGLSYSFPHRLSVGHSSSRGTQLLPLTRLPAGNSSSRKTQLLPPHRLPAGHFLTPPLTMFGCPLPQMSYLLR